MELAEIMQPDETFEVTDPHVACDGGDGPLGHPRIYLMIGEAGEVVCPYCSRRYILVAAPEEASGD